MKPKFLMTFVTMSFFAVSSFAAPKAGKVVQAGEEAGKVIKETVKPTRPGVGVTPGMSVTGSQVGSGAKSVTSPAAANIFDIHSNGTKASGITAEKLGQSCTGGVFTNLPGALVANIRAAQDLGYVNSNNCFGEFEKEGDLAARIATALGEQNSALGVDTVKTATTDTKARSVLAFVKKFYANTKTSVVAGVGVVKDVCAVTKPDGSPQYCLWNASMCDQAVLARATALAK